jgi:hypothetical protein
MSGEYWSWDSVRALLLYSGHQKCLQWEGYLCPTDYVRGLWVVVGRDRHPLDKTTSRRDRIGLTKSQMRIRVLTVKKGHLQLWDEIRRVEIPSRKLTDSYKLGVACMWPAFD